MNELLLNAYGGNNKETKGFPKGGALTVRFWRGVCVCVCACVCVGGGGGKHLKSLSNII